MINFTSERLSFGPLSEQNQRALDERKDLIIDWQILKFRLQEGAWEIYGKDTVQERWVLTAKNQYNTNFDLKVVGNEKEGGSGRWQTIGIGLGLRRSIFFWLLILLSPLFQCISPSAK
jgi:hypothetical protein